VIGAGAGLLRALSSPRSFSTSLEMLILSGPYVDIGIAG
jgi:hypothetical protein